MDEGAPHCADFVYIRAAPGFSVAPVSARLAGGAPAPGDDTLYPSDHLGVVATLAIKRLPGSSGGGGAARR
jgi:hypothetical protein